MNSPRCRAFKKFTAERIRRAREISKPVVACADSGAELAYPDVVPDIIIGDFDSVSKDTLGHYAALGVELKRFPADKDFTDFHLALREAYKMAGNEASRITVFGGLGRRLDQTLANIFVAACFQNENSVAVSLHEAGTHVYTASAAFANPLSVEEFVDAGDTITLRPLYKSVTVAKTSGLKYGLKNEKLDARESRGTSNVATGGRVEIEISAGELLLVHIQK